MYTTRVASTHSTRPAAQALKALNGLSRSVVTVVALRPGLIAIQQQQPWTMSKRHFSATPQTQIRDFFPERETDKVRKTEAAWAHPM